MTAAVQMNDVYKFYGTFHALKDINLTVAKSQKEKRKDRRMWTVGLWQIHYDPHN